MKQRKTDNDLIDSVYATIGMIRACRLPDGVALEFQPFIDFTMAMVDAFLENAAVNGETLGWILELIKGNFRLTESTFKSVCEAVLKGLGRTSPGVDRAMQLSRAVALSSSPILRGMPEMERAIQGGMTELIRENSVFLRKYVFGSFVRCVWDQPNPLNRLSDGVRAWRQFIIRLRAKMQDPPVLVSVLTAVVIDSLSFFGGYYGEVQPSRARAKDMQKDIFAIAETSASLLRGPNLREEAQQHFWFLLYVAAMTGASDDDIASWHPIPYKGKDPLFLGLDHDATGFKDWREALGRLGHKFASESEAFPMMAQFLRKNFSAS